KFEFDFSDFRAQPRFDLADFSPELQPKFANFGLDCLDICLSREVRGKRFCQRLSGILRLLGGEAGGFEPAGELERVEGNRHGSDISDIASSGNGSSQALAAMAPGF